MKSLMDETRRLLKESDIPRYKLAEAIGVTRVWIRDFERGNYIDPGVNKIQKLYEILSGEPLL